MAGCDAWHGAGLAMRVVSCASPSDLRPSRSAPSDLWPGLLAPSGLRPSRLAPSDLRPSLLAPSYLRPSRLAPSDLRPSLLAPSGLWPSCVAQTASAEHAGHQRVSAPAACSLLGSCPRPHRVASWPCRHHPEKVYGLVSCVLLSPVILFPCLPNNASSWLISPVSPGRSHFIAHRNMYAVVVGTGGTPFSRIPTIPVISPSSSLPFPSFPLPHPFHSRHSSFLIPSIPVISPSSSLPFPSFPLPHPFHSRHSPFLIPSIPVIPPSSSLPFPSFLLPPHLSASFPSCPIFSNLQTAAP
eukprot:365195-Chlamydomonas_euryale.AAC.9